MSNRLSVEELVQAVEHTKDLRGVLGLEDPPVLRGHAGSCQRPAYSMSDLRPLLFLDVDGVLNPLDLPPGHELRGFDDYDIHRIDIPSEYGYRESFVVHLSPSMGARLA